jgi:TPR repeat protein
MKRSFAFVLLVVFFAGAARADFDSGLVAYEIGDYGAALKVWEPLANDGNTDAQFHLGEMYLQGKGVDQDFKMAADWLAKAAQAGHPKAQGMLGGLYAAGLGVPQDFRESYFWMIIAAIWSQAEIRQQAMDSLGDVAKQLEAEEKQAIAQQAVSKWR